MKTAYELAMERLSQAAPAVKLTAQQKKDIGELESKYAAKIAERELFIKGEIVKSIDKGDEEAIAQLEKQLASDRKSLRAELEEKKAEGPGDQIGGSRVFAWRMAPQLKVVQRHYDE
jgi:hypothetical protein